MNEAKIKQNLMRIACIGQEMDGGISRIFGGKAYDEAVSVMEEYMRDAGMDVYIDPVGNVHGFYASKNSNDEEIVIGSHLDTVKNGGIYDGLLGIVAGVECVRKLNNEEKRLNYKIHIVATNGEEGNELGGTFGSRSMMGMLNLDDQEFLAKSAKYGYSKKMLQNAAYDTRKCRVYLELHIEQGKTLEESHKKIGVVSGIVGLRRYLIEINGTSNHAGTTMMEYRNDALVHAAQVITLVDELTRNIGNNLVATFSKVEVTPNEFAVINRRTSMVLECRNQETECMDKFISGVKEILHGVSGASIQELVDKLPVACNQDVINVIEDVCIRKNCQYQIMPSGATHDGNYFAKRIPIGMIFVPSKKGISHCKEEETDWDDIILGINVLYETIVEFDKRREQ